ncbi:MAG: hypothetical protein KKC46_01955 [Proteobacteria bacterium]|nr:hypothetical protein [Pseudomonadota bacterium]
MSASQSDLSNSQYGYDMVLAVTEASVNAAMEQWLSGYSGTPFTQAYVYDQENQIPVLTDYDELVNTVGFDPFTIPDGTATTDRRITALTDLYFLFAFQIETGIPDFPVADIPPVINMDQQGSNVTYNMVCKQFKIIAVEPAVYGPSIWLNKSQDDSTTPWCFSFTVDLNLQSDDINNHFSKLPEETQEEIKNLGIDLFSVQQLFLDLNTAGLSNIPTISGIDPTSQTYVYMTTVFINTYIAGLSEDGGIMLGLSVISSQPFPDNASLIPTDLNFEISSYKSSDGNGTSDYDAYTLNYLVMSNGDSMPAPVQFTWNWIDIGDITQYAGVMAINRTTFVNFLIKLLSSSLSSISKKPHVHFHVNLTEAYFEWGYESDDSDFSFDIVPDGGTHILTYQYYKSDESKDTFGNWGEFKVEYTAQSDVYIEGTSITIETDIHAHCYLNVDGGTASGNWASFTSQTVYTIGVDSNGTITVSESDPVITDNSEKPDPDKWLKLITLDQINDVVDKIKDTYKEWIGDFLRNDAQKICDMLNGSNTWVFPGGSTFTFSNAAFSENQDLVANVLYIDPSDADKR